MKLIDNNNNTVISQRASASTRGTRFDGIYMSKPDFDELARLSPVELFEWFRSVSFGFRASKISSEFKKQFMCDFSSSKDKSVTAIIDNGKISEIKNLD